MLLDYNALGPTELMDARYTADLLDCVAVGAQNLEFVMGTGARGGGDGNGDGDGDGDGG